MVVMVKKRESINFDYPYDSLEARFPIYQVLDNEGKVINTDLDPTLSDEKLIELMKDLVWGRTLDERIFLLNRQGALGNYAPAGGQEASQLASLFALQKGDYLLPTYRDVAPLVKHGLPLYKGFLWYKGHVVANKYEQDFHALPPQTIVGGTIIHAMGIALGMKKNKKNNVVMTYCGDGATSQGDFYEGLNFAGVYNVPLIVIVQNNGYGISVPLEKQTKTKSLAQKALAAGIPGIRVDGMDPLAMYAVVNHAREHALNGKGPILIEAITYRFGPHTMSDDPKRYRSDEEVEAWKKKDPVSRLRKYLFDKKLWTEEMEMEVQENCKKEVKEAMEALRTIEKQKVSEFLKNMYEIQPQNIIEQIKEYEEKEKK